MNNQNKHSQSQASFEDSDSSWTLEPMLPAHQQPLRPVAPPKDVSILEVGDWQGLRLQNPEPHDHAASPLVQSLDPFASDTSHLSSQDLHWWRMQKKLETQWAHTMTPLAWKLWNSRAGISSSVEWVGEGPQAQPMLQGSWDFGELSPSENMLLLSAFGNQARMHMDRMVLSLSIPLQSEHFREGMDSHVLFLAEVGQRLVDHQQPQSQIQLEEKKSRFWKLP